MNEKILCVDDEPNILAGFQRNLRKQFDLVTAAGGQEALAALEKQGPFAVAVSDMKMPWMNGIELLARIRELAPDTVRMMLTGNADISTAIEAVNQGNIFRFLTKPCSPENLATALTAGLAQYRLITAEHELLNKTLHGAIKMLTDILSIVEPESFGRAQMLRNLLQQVSRDMALQTPWEIELASMLAEVGMVTIPPEVLLKLRENKALTDIERGMVGRVPEIGHNLLLNIPRLENVAAIVRHHQKRFDGIGHSPDGVWGEALPLGARVLKILSDLAQLELARFTRAQALDELRSRSGWYDPELLSNICRILNAHAYEAAAAGVDSVAVTVKELQLGQILLSDVQTNDGQLLISEGFVLSETMLERIQNYAKLVGVREPIFVRREPDRHLDFSA